MGMLTTQNVEEYKQKYAEELKAKSIELGTDITDEMITEKQTWIIILFTRHLILMVNMQT